MKKPIHWFIAATIFSSTFFLTKAPALAAEGAQAALKTSGQIKSFNDVTTRTVTLDDGTYSRDDAGRVTKTVSADGKLVMTFEYADKNDPLKPTAVTVGDTTYKNIGAITSSGKPVTQDGLVMYSWSRYRGGRFVDNWYGYIGISKNGVFISYDYHEKSGKTTGAGGNHLSEHKAASRDQGGIWPGKVELSRPDGSTLTADLLGLTVEKLVEATTINGTTIERVFTRSGNEWQSKDDVPEIRRELKVDSRGTLSYRSAKDELIVVHPDARRDVTLGDTTRTFDSDGAVIAVCRGTEARRDLNHAVDATGRRTLVLIRSSAGGSVTTWQRKDQTDQWCANGVTEIRLNLCIKEDGAVEFTDSSGLRVRETLDLARIEFDRQDRPVKVSFPRGATRTLSYDRDGLNSFVDFAPQKNKAPMEAVWNRKDDKGTFESARPGGIIFVRGQVCATLNGDISYVSQSGVAITSEALDLDRMSRGEFVMTGEAVAEARQTLKAALKKTNIERNRFLKWLDEFEEKAAKNNVKPEAVALALANLAEILNSTSQSPLYDQNQKENIVEVAMHNLARPLEIDQGSHPTCNVTSVEVYSAVRHPDEYTRLLAEIVSSGTWKTFDGRTVTPPRKSLIPGEDEKSYDAGKPDSGLRSLTSQIIQMTLINAMYETGRMNSTETLPNGQKQLIDRSGYRYILGPKQSKTERQGGYTVTVDLGEDMLVDAGGNQVKNKKNEPVDGPEMVQDQVLESCLMMFGQKPEYIKNSGYADLPNGKREYFNDLPTGERLLKWKTDGKLPVLAPTMGGMHAQTIHDVWQDPKTGTVWVLLDNQHGEPEVKGRTRKSGEGDGDGWITLDVLHMTLKMSPQGSGLGQPVMPLVNKYDHPRHLALKSY